MKQSACRLAAQDAAGNSLSLLAVPEHRATRADGSSKKHSQWTLFNVMNTNSEVRIIGKDDLDIEKIRAEINHMLFDARRHDDEREKLRAETTRIQSEAKWHPLVAGAGIFAAGAGFLAALIGIVKLFMK